ncbi:MAG: DUF1304 domain-containing protein [Candidatus Sericytochromatia bacterium]|nr:DUF1304 domain-containing protein [Candidatus Sericytochromatia bacterium]
MGHYLLMGLVGFVAIQHVAFAVLEGILWRHPLGRRIFGLSKEHAEITATMALNQGLYNLFLAAGLLWSLLHPDPAASRALQVFFLGCVTVAGFVGGLTVKKLILVVQGVPAGIALVILLLP